MPLTTVTRVQPREGGGYDVHVRYTKAKVRRKARAAGADRRPGGVLGRGARRSGSCNGCATGVPAADLGAAGPPGPDQLEQIGGVIAPDTTVDYSQGVAITSSFHPTRRPTSSRCGTARAAT